MDLINKNIIFTGRFLLILLLVLPFHPGQISAGCSIVCDGECGVARNQCSDVFVEVILNHGDCCSNQSEQSENLPPCCNVEQDSPEDGRFFLLNTSRVSFPDFIQIEISAFENRNIFLQTGFYPREYFVLNPTPSAPLYILNLSLLC
jgi:hypothetical protein